MKRRFTILTAALALLAFLAIPMGMKGQTTTLVSGSGTSGYSIPDGWTSSGTVEGGSYLKFDNGTITSPEFAPHNGLSFTYSVATFGSGTNHPLTIRILNASTNAVISEMTTATPTSSTYINTGSPLSLGDVTVAFKIQMYGPTGKGVRLRNYSVTGTPAGGQQLTPSDLALVDAPVELEFDLYDNANAQTISYTTSSTGAVTVSQNNYITATVNVNNTITVTPVAVTNGPQTITVTQAADATYATGSVTFTVDIEDSTPFTGGDVTFLAGTDLGSTTENNSPDEMEKNGVTVYSTDAAFATAQYRLYKSSVTTISVESGTITNIVFNGQSTSYPVSNLSVNGNNGSYTVSNNVGTWTGNSNEISFSASSGQVRLSSIVVTVETSGTPDPTISANNVDIAYNATSGSITYTINNEPSPAGTLTAAVTDGNWLTLGQGTTSPIAFTCTANENTTARTATVTLTYTYNTDQTVSANVTVTQAAAPVSYNTIPALFAAATSTEAAVYVTFNNWVVSGISTNGKNVFVTDNNGNGFVIYDNNGGLENTYTVGDILAGTTVSCNLKKYNGFAELLNVDANDLTITTGGTVTVANVAMADLAGVNTGALLHYDNLTCSVDNNKYYLSNGTTTIQVYNALYAFEALEDGKTYNITGIYQQFNNTKEILPRSAADIVKVEVQHNEYTLTVGTLNEHINGIFVFDAAAPNTQLIADGQAGTAQVLDGTEVLVSVDVEEGYTIESLIVDGNNVTSQIIDDAYTFTMPTHAVTITATVVESVTPPTPVGGDYVRITSLDQLTDGSKVIIAARYDEEVANGYYAMPNVLATNTNHGKPEGVAFTSTTSGTEEVLPNTIVNEEATYYWTVGVSNNVYTFTSANGDMIGWASSTDFSYANGANKDWTVERSTAGNSTMVPGYTGFLIKNVNTNTRAFAYNGSIFGAYSTTANLNGSSYNFFLDFFVQSQESETYSKHIIGYNSEEGNGTGNYYLIASPIGNVAPTEVTNMTSGSYDLFYFDHSRDLEWVNYKQQTGSTNPGFGLVSGKGYLYANSQTVDLVFTGTARSTEDVEIVLDRTETADGYTIDMPGWNLVGNPYAEDFAYIDIVSLERPFYTMNDDGTGFEAVSSGSIEPMEGVFVVAEEDGETMTFTTTPPAGKGKGFALNLSDGRNNIDRAIVRFNKGRTLPKLQLFENSTKVYIPMDGQDYAVVRSEEMGEMPVNFKAENNGSYSLSLSCDNVEFAYLHLIDNLTGKDIDLLQTPSYSFEAKTTDYESRFNLVYATGAADSSDSFAFYSNGSFVINNEGNATLQVIDVTGRILKSESVNGCANVNVNATPGVYMLRLINGENVKVQKVVVK